MTTRLFVVAGESSGDAHAAGVLEALLASDSPWEFRGLGGPRMHGLAAGVEDWIDDAAVVGLWEVLRRYPYFKQRFEQTARAILEWKPDAVLLVDYPGFNLRMASRLRQRGYTGKILYFVSPQVWAWNRGRIPKMARWLDLMLCILPFEPELYRASGLQSVFIGHPLVDKVAGLPAVERERDLVALLPGSREREIAKHWPVLLEAARRLRVTRPELRFATSAPGPKRAELLTSMTADAGLREAVTIDIGGAEQLMQRATVGAVASGTATLQAALLGLPMILIYKVAPLTYWVGRRVIKVPYLGMVNLLANRQVVPELIQRALTPERTEAELARLLDNPEQRHQMQESLRAVTADLGQPGVGARAATEIRQFLETQKGLDEMGGR